MNHQDMVLRRITNSMWVAGIALLILAAVLYFLPEDVPGAAIERPEREWETLPVGNVAKAVFEIDNPTGHAVKVVGLAVC